MRIAMISIVVRDYDEAIQFYVEKLGFQLIEDTHFPEQAKRWVVVSPSNAGENEGATILLAKASSAEQSQFVGNQTGGRVMAFLHTDDFYRDYEKFHANGVEFVREPLQAPYGMVAVFKDLYGNLWDLIGPSK